MSDDSGPGRGELRGIAYQAVDSRWRKRPRHPKNLTMTIVELPHHLADDSRHLFRIHLRRNNTSLCWLSRVTLIGKKTLNLPGQFL